MKTIVLILLVGAVYVDAAAKGPYRPCEEAQRQQSNPQRYCGNNGNIYPNKHAFECAKLTNSRLRRISCQDSLILAKNALGNIREQNRNGQLTQREKVERLRQRHEQQQRQRELEQQQRLQQQRSG